MAFTKEIKQKLIEACESGEYKWCGGKFEETKNGVTYNCVVEVLCKVFGIPLYQNEYSRWNNYEGLRKAVGEGKCVPEGFTSKLWYVNDGIESGHPDDKPGSYPINFIKSLQTCD